MRDGSKPTRVAIASGAEVRGRHAGVAALLVHLITGSLDQNTPSAVIGVRERRFDDEGMGRTT